MGRGGFLFAGVQYGHQCFCGQDAPSMSRRTYSSECDKSCPGDKSLACGGYCRMNVYSTNIGCEKSTTTTTTTFSSMAPVNPAISASTNNSFLPSSGRSPPGNSPGAGPRHSAPPGNHPGTTKLQPLHVYMSPSSGNENNCID